MKTVLITGASSGFGKACAEKFATSDYRLILIARRKERLEQMAEELSCQTEVAIISADITDKNQLITALNELPESFKKIDICINNAGLAFGVEPAFNGDIDEWEVMIDTNIKGLLYCTHYVLPQMVERNRGHIINLGSIAGSIPYQGSNIYGASKAFIKMFSQNLKTDLLGTQIRVTNIEPGLAQTEFSEVRFRGDTAKAEALYEGTKPILPEDIADMVFWAANTPSHININSIEVMPVCQAWGGTAVHKE